MSPIAGAVAEQFDRAWAELRDTIEKTPEDQWRTPDPCGDPHLTPARHALHAVMAVDACMKRSREEAFSPEARAKRRFSIEWEEAPAAALPSRSELLAYLDDMAKKLDVRLKGLSDADLAAPSPFPWTGKNAAGHWMYALRHTQHHYAVMNTMLRTRGLERGKWK